MNRTKYFYVVFLIVFFFLGVYLWKIQHRGRSVEMINDAEYIDVSNQDHSVFVYVGDKSISMNDIDFEFRLHTDGLINSPELTSIPQITGDVVKHLAPLRQRLAAGIIERKLLYRAVEEDKSFDLSNPNRFTQCLSDWKAALTSYTKFTEKSVESEHLKQRICELSIIDQYLEEKVFSEIKLTPKEVEGYYQEHPNEFKVKDRVIVRHILSATEQDARKVRDGLTPSNFEDKAREFSIAPESQKGGILGPFARGEYPAVFDVAFSMGSGQISDILKSDYGFHIIMIIKKLPATTKSLGESKLYIEQILAKKKREDVYTLWLDKALQISPVKTPRAF